MVIVGQYNCLPMAAVDGAIHLRMNLVVFVTEVDLFHHQTTVCRQLGSYGWAQVFFVKTPTAVNWGRFVAHPCKYTIK